MDLERRADSTFRKENLPRCDDHTGAMLLRRASRKAEIWGIYGILACFYQFVFGDHSCGAQSNQVFGNRKTPPHFGTNSPKNTLSVCRPP